MTVPATARTVSEFVAVSSPGVDAASRPTPPPPVTSEAADAAPSRRREGAALCTLSSLAPASTLLHLAVLSYLHDTRARGWRT